MTTTPVNSIGDALFTKTQQKVLALLFAKPDERFYTNEIMRWAAIGRGTVSRELNRLVSAGVLTSTKEGNQIHYQANPICPIYEELTSIVRKTFGVSDVLRQALRPIENKIELAFIYGSIAKGGNVKSSDIDLLLVGQELSYVDVIGYLLPLESSLKRSINPTIFEKHELIEKLNSASSFLSRVIEQPKIWIIGGEDDLRIA